MRRLFNTAIVIAGVSGLVIIVVASMSGKARAQTYPLPKPGQTVIYPGGTTGTTLPAGTTVFSNGQTAVPVGPNTYFSNGVTCMPVGPNVVCQ